MFPHNAPEPKPVLHDIRCITPPQIIRMMADDLYQLADDYDSFGHEDRRDILKALADFRADLDATGVWR